MTASGPAALETARLHLRRLQIEDAPFILELLNDPDWLRYIGDKQVRTLADAQRYLQQGPLAMYERLGLGLLLVQSKADGAPIGLCGLLKRETLPHEDIGFAFLPAWRGGGYAREAAAAVLGHARDALGLRRIAAITTQDNTASGRLLVTLGFRYERDVQLADDSERLRLYAWEAATVA